MDHDELQELLGDYVLDLLPPAQAWHVSGHLATCAACRRRVEQERRVGNWVAETVSAATAIDASRLHALMPRPPIQARAGYSPPTWTRQLVPLTVVLLVLLFGALMRAPQNQPPLPALFANTSTATMTHTPTATLAQSITSAATAATLAPTVAAAETNAAQIQETLSTPPAPHAARLAPPTR